jgi:hypothetical protein
LFGRPEENSITLDARWTEDIPQVSV